MRWLKKIDPESELQLLNLKESGVVFFAGSGFTVWVTNTLHAQYATRA